MNVMRARSKLLMIAQFVTEEGQLHPRGRVRAELTHASIQLAFLARSIERQDIRTVQAFVVSTIALVAHTAAARAFGGTMAEITHVLDQGAATHPQRSQLTCQNEATHHGIQWVCQLPILHAGDHACGGERWPR